MKKYVAVLGIGESDESEEVIEIWAENQEILLEEIAKHLNISIIVTESRDESGAV